MTLLTRFERVYAASRCGAERVSGWAHALRAAPKSLEGRKQLVALGAAGAARRATRLRAAARGAEDDVLSPRESEILRLVADGLSNKEIAAELGLSPHTVHRHVANILVKLRLSSRAAAAAYAARQGLID